MLKRLGVRVWRWLPGWTRGALTWCLNAHFIVGAVAIIENGEGGVLLARHTYRRDAPWALPGGWVQRGEDPSNTIVREILEETGLTVEVLAPARRAAGKPAPPHHRLLSPPRRRHVSRQRRGLRSALRAAGRLAGRPS